MSIGRLEKVKTIKNLKTYTLKSGRGWSYERWSFTRVFNCRALAGKVFGAVDRYSSGLDYGGSGGETGVFDCTHSWLVGR